MKWLSLLLALLIGSAQAQSPVLPGPGLPVASASYTGLGDIVGSATAFGSCARVYQASQASTSTSLCDLVDSAAPTTVICTLRGSATGFVDLANAYCTGSVTPTTKCAAATGGHCNVSKVYDQVAGLNPWSNSTAASQPVLVFSSLNGLPGMTGTSAAGTNLASTNSLTIAQPISMTAVYERTVSGATNGGVNMDSSAALGIQAGAANTANIANSNTSLTAADGSFHAVQDVSASGAGASVINVDGTEATGTGTTSLSAATLRIGRRIGNNSLNGTIMEVGLWPSGFSSGQRTSMNSNMHGANGYNF